MFTRYHQNLSGYYTQILFLGLSLLCAVPAHAAHRGVYLQGQLGASRLDYKYDGIGLTQANTSGRIGLAGRVSVGYAFDKNWSIEMGYLRAHPVRFDAINGLAGNNGKLNQYSWDLTTTATLPFPHHLDLFVKLGVARTTAKPDTHIAAASTNLNRAETITNILMGIGGGYRITAHWRTDLSLIHLTGSANIRTTDALLLGLGYHF